ncbi:P-loop containing nucleoside triphosphate hydrolase protein [Apiospora arundinis]|uniref:P-loop containing nucleoside triphosphate hydrolase protein n=1 Tax=Apiospora arundinis TaxID=335852 RepID=A0ABR2HP25_9PEZI
MSLEEYDQYLSDSNSGTCSAPNPMRVEFRDVTEHLNPHGEVVSLRPTMKRDSRIVSANRYADIAMLIRRRVDFRKEPVFLRLEIQSIIIQKAIQACCANGIWINTKVKPDSAIISDSPYMALFHARKELTTYCLSPERTKEEKVHLKLLTDFMDKQFGGMDKERDRLVSFNKITFDLYWTLFQPYETVVKRDENYIECFRLRSLRLQERGDGDTFVLEGIGWDFSSGWFGPVIRKGYLEKFDGAMDISNLTIYPLRFHPSGKTTLTTKLAQRGHKWATLLEKAHVDYKGVAWETRPALGPPRSHPGGAPMPHGAPGPYIPQPQYGEPESNNSIIHVDSRIILDYNTFCTHIPHLRTSLSLGAGVITDMEEADDTDEYEESAKEATGSADPEPEDRITTLLVRFFKAHRKDASYTMDDDLAMLCPARARGYSLSDKTWGFFLIDKCSEIEWRQDAVSRLEVDPRIKSVIQALLAAHHADQNLDTPFDDVVPGKGRGLVFLFAGDPGLGKTMTAECFTEQNRKPLYTITSGELGTDSVTTDNRLRDLFKLAKSWGAYLLLDEADVFLARRSHSDLTRNGLVTIFLRQIEYYGGVIFLTTNRLKEFDPAFESRIQFKHLFEPLTFKQRANIWKNLLCDWAKSSRDDDSHKPDEWSEEMFSRLGSQYELNGRQIRNLIKNALALAQAEKTPLSETHLLTVSETNQSWDKRLKELE